MLRTPAARAVLVAWITIMHVMNWVMCEELQQPQQGDMRLSGARDGCAGRVERFYTEGGWGTICHESWGLKAAGLVCQQLRCGEAVAAPTSSYFGPSSGEIWANRYSCPNGTRRLGKCRAQLAFEKMDLKCDHSMEAGAVCSDHGKLRLMNGDGRCSGRVEVYFREQWGTVCSDGWGISAASVVCRQLGCGHAVWAPPAEAPFGEGDGQVWLDGVRCSGMEAFLWQCQSGELGKNSCSHHKDAGVVCSEDREKIQLRLVNGPNPCAGTLEVYYRGQWGTVCDETWDLNEAEVVCRQLGCGYPLNPPNNHFGPGTGPVWVDTLDCEGHERSLLECQSRPWGQGTCSHLKDAMVSCSGGDGPLKLRLVNGSDSCSGTLEVFYRGEWGTICGSSWDLNEAEVACRQLGCGKALSAPRRAHFGPGTGRVWVDEVSCRGDEFSLLQCQSQGWDNGTCPHTEDAGVSCSVNRGAAKLRLVNGSDSCSGTLEIFYREEWGKLCGSSWNLSEAEVACRQLGCGYPLSAHIRPGAGQVWVNEVNCKGKELSLFQCQSQAWVLGTCPHAKYAGVSCSGQLKQHERPSERLGFPFLLLICVVLGFLLLLALMGLCMQTRALRGARKKEQARAPVRAVSIAREKEILETAVEIPSRTDMEPRHYKNRYQLEEEQEDLYQNSDCYRMEETYDIAY